MKWRDLLANWGLKQIKFSLGFMDASWEPQHADRIAAWEMYVELLTRITTQPLADCAGSEKAALECI